MPMNPEIKAQWTAALRSGEYQQGKENLAEGGKFCCLGVLCELAVKAGAVTSKIPYPSDDEPRIWYGSGDEDLTLPQEVMDWAGLTDSNPFVSEDLPEGALRQFENSQPCLAELNDAGTPFTIIADIIDAQL